MIRYLLDRRGRLAISFRADGKFPNVTVRPENRAVAQVFRRSFPQKAGEPAVGGGKSTDKNEKKNWLPESLEQLLKQWTFDAMELRDIYLETLPEHIAYVKFIFESYEEVGIIRTVDRKKAIIVLLAMNDFLDTARKILESIKREVPIMEIPRPADVGDDWFMAELVVESS